MKFTSVRDSSIAYFDILNYEKEIINWNNEI